MIVKQSQAPSFLLPGWHLCEVSSLPPRKCFEVVSEERERREKGGGFCKKRERKKKHATHEPVSQTSQWDRPITSLAGCQGRYSAYFPFLVCMLLCFCSVDNLQIIIKKNCWGKMCKISFQNERKNEKKIEINKYKHLRNVLLNWFKIVTLCHRFF